MNLAHVWGYGAVIVPKKLATHEFVILDPGRKDLTSSIVHAENVAKWAYQAAGHEPTHDEIFGALQAALVECYTTKSFASGQASIFASAIAKRADKKFWIVVGKDVAKDEPAGMTTTFHVLDVCNAERAREEIAKWTEPAKVLNALHELMRGDRESK